jgi:SAM-dependent methyltransferase
VDISIEDVGGHSDDFIYSLNVLEHIENDVDALKLWRTKLKPGGSMIFYDRFVFPFSRLFDFFCCYLWGKNVYVVGKFL